MATFTTVKQPPSGYLKVTSKPKREIADAHFAIYQDSAKGLFGDSPKLTSELQDEEQLFHEACVFFPSEDEDHLFVTSNILERKGSKAIKLSLLVRSRNSPRWKRKDINEGDGLMANGAVNCPDMQHLLICAQGDLHSIGGLVKMSAKPPYKTEPVLTNYHGRQFNSVNDVVYAKDGSIWFTDPDYGLEQGFRPPSELPNLIYRYDEATQDLRVMADGLAKPNGLCFSPDEKTLYITDTDWQHGDGSTEMTRASHIYAYTVSMHHGGPFLTEKRFFAMADTGVPDGIKCDTEGRVYSGTGDGVSIWAPSGTLLAKIIVPGGCANFCFGRPGEMFILNETRFWVATFQADIQGALLQDHFQKHFPSIMEELQAFILSSEAKG